MDQLKEILRQAIKYRFWIAVGLSALLPLIGFFVGSGKVKGEATGKKNEIEGADKGVKEYMSGTVPTAEWSAAVKKKTEVMSTDVNSAWRKLYERQAPLLQWPKDPPEIEEKFNSWGKKWPEGIDAVAVQIIIDRYINVYGTEVDKVYQICRPWKPEDGTGVVVVPPKEMLLQPFPFDANNPPSDLGKIWGAQEKLWVQGALLEVVDRVNKNAKDWDTAVIKQINDLQVANMLALDQMALAKGDTLKPAPEITAGGGAGAPPPAAAPEADAGGGAAMMPGAAGGFGSSGMSGMGMGGAETMTVSYLGSSTEQYQIVPVSMSILIDQNSINNFLIELANSPMAIRVMDYEQNRPTARVVRPEKGQSSDFGFGMYSGMPGGSSDMMFNARMAGGRMMMPGSAGMSDSAAMPGGYFGGGSAPRQVAHGTDLRQRDMAKEKEEKKKAREAVKVQIHDPYYNIVEVRIYGQARFYNAPPSEQPAPESPGATAAADAGAATPAPAPAATDGNAPAPAAAEPPKDDAAAAPKTDEAKPADAGAAAPKEDAPKAEAPKEETPKEKDAAPKDEAATTEPAKTEAPKQEAPAPATPKANEPAPAPAPKA